MWASIRAFEVMENRTKLQIILHGLEGGFDFDKLDVKLPKLRRILCTEIGAQEIATFTSPHLAQLLSIERKGECGSIGGDIDIDDPPGYASSGARGAELHEQFLAIDVHAAISLSRAQSHLSL